MSKTTLDLSTLSDITDGTHTVKVKAKADGYRDSEFSNEVSYTKTTVLPSFILSFIEGKTGDDIPTYIKIGDIPLSAEDYDYVTKGDGSHAYGSSYLYDKAGNKITNPVYKQALRVYVWGFSVTKNTSVVNLYKYYKTYDSALDISIMEGDTIKIQCQYFYD